MPSGSGSLAASLIVSASDDDLLPFLEPDRLGNVLYDTIRGVLETGGAGTLVKF